MEHSESLFKAASDYSNAWYCSDLKHHNKTGCGCVGINDAYIAGAKYQRNSVWHDANEKPETMNSVILLRNAGVDCTMYLDNTYWDDVNQWCYLKDIIPTKD